MQKGLCHGCLKPGHVFKICRNKSICEICRGKHPSCIHGDYEALHSSPQASSEKNSPPSSRSSMGRDEETSNISATVHQVSGTKDNACRSSMTVPVYVSMKDNPSKEFMMYALLDTQSDTTFIAEETLLRTEAKTQPARLKISTMTSSTSVSCNKLRGLLEGGIKSQDRIELPLTYSKEYIPVNKSHIPTPEIIRGWPHLQELADHLHPLQDCEVGLLIGYDCPQALAPLNVKLGDGDEPFGVETALGWSVVGKVQAAEIQECQSHRVTVQEEISLPRVVRILESDFIENKENREQGEATKLSQEDVTFFRLIGEGIHQDEDNFYEMPLPF